MLAKLPPIAEDVERLQNKLKDYEKRALAAEERLMSVSSPAEAPVHVMPEISGDFDETLRNTLVSAQRQADVTVAEATAEAARLREEAHLQASSLIEEARLEATEVVRDAKAQTQEVLTDLEIEKVSRLESLSKEVATKRSELEEELRASHVSERDALIAQIRDLSETHRLLRRDVERFESHLGKRRGDIQGALEEIAAVLDNPSKLREQMPLESEDLEDFDPNGFQDIALNLSGLDSLAEEVASASASFNAEPKVEAQVEVEEVETAMISAEIDAFISAEVQQINLSSEIEVIEIPETYEPEFEAEVFIEESFMTDELAAIPPQPSAEYTTSDPFLEELKRATTEQSSEDDTIQAFLDSEVEEEGSAKAAGWFGRKK